MVVVVTGDAGLLFLGTETSSRVLDMDLDNLIEVGGLESRL